MYFVVSFSVEATQFVTVDEPDAAMYDPDVNYSSTTRRGDHSDYDRGDDGGHVDRDATTAADGATKVGAAKAMTMTTVTT